MEKSLPCRCHQERQEEQSRHQPHRGVYSHDFGRSIDKLPIWGRLESDFGLFGLGFLTPTHLQEMYKMEPASCIYLLSNLLCWKEEVDFLNMYMGRQPNMPARPLELVHKRARRIGQSILVIGVAEEEIFRHIDHKWQMEVSLREFS